MVDSATSQQRRTLIVGLGKTGLSCARYLAAHGYSVAITDSREQPPELTALREELPDTAVFLGGFSEEALARADQLVVSPGIPVQSGFVAKARAMGLPVFGDIELFAKAAAAPVVAVTGSNGKSTVTSLVGFMAKTAGRQVRVGGNLGIPALELLDSEAELYVLELSSFQLEVTNSLACVAAAVLNISDDHLDRYASREDYAAAKARIYAHAETAIVNRDDPIVATMPRPGQRQIGFRLGEADAEDYGLVQHDGGTWLAKGRKPLLAVSDMLVHGRHNQANALASLALGEAAGLPVTAMLDALRRFHGLPHRMEWVARINGVTWLDDSKATNVGATLAAVSGIESPLVLIAGGDAKGQDFTAFAQLLAKRAKAAILLGKDAKRIADALGEKITHVCVANLAEAVANAQAMTQPGDVVLLSPACSSLDMFENFEQRGRMFAQAVKRLAHE